QVISRLLVVQGSIITTMTEALLLLGKGAKDAGPSTRSALLPLMAESFLTYFATTGVLLTVLEKYSGGTKRPRERPEKLVALADKYETDLKLMRELYKKADDVEEVAVMKRTPRLPMVSPLSEGGAKKFREMSRKSSRQSTFGRASSKMEALRTLQDEERRFVDNDHSQRAARLLAGTGEGTGPDEEDDGDSDDDDDDDHHHHDHNNRVDGGEDEETRGGGGAHSNGVTDALGAASTGAIPAGIEYGDASDDHDSTGGGGRSGRRRSSRGGGGGGGVGVGGGSGGSDNEGSGGRVAASASASSPAGGKRTAGG
ncbi:unnamed protein product, partial [Laminaria digitata]